MNTHKQVGLLRKFELGGTSDTPLDPSYTEIGINDHKLGHILNSRHTYASRGPKGVQIMEVPLYVMYYTEMSLTFSAIGCRQVGTTSSEREKHSSQYLSDKPGSLSLLKWTKIEEEKPKIYI